MSTVNQLQIQYNDYCQSLLREGIVDDQFTELRKLQDEEDPDFFVGIFSTFFEEAEQAFKNLATALEQQGVDFNKVSSCVHKLKGSSLSMGAVRVANACITFRSFCDAQNREECLKCLGQLIEECALLNNKLQTLFGIGTQILAAGGTIPGVD